MCPLKRIRVNIQRPEVGKDEQQDAVDLMKSYQVRQISTTESQYRPLSSIMADILKEVPHSSGILSAGFRMTRR